MVKVSIVVSAHNVASNIDKCLFSLVNQTLNEIEIIIINNESTDNTIDIIEEYSGKYPEKIIYKTIENTSAANVKNAALKMAQGEYIGFVEGNDEAALTMFEKMYCKAIESDADIVTCEYNRISLGKTKQSECKERDCFGNSVFQAPSLYTRNIPDVWNKIFKRSFIERENMYFENMDSYEDFIFTYKLFLKANRIEQVPEVLYSSYVREMKCTYKERSETLLAALELLAAYHETNKAMLTFEEELLYIFLDHIFEMCEEKAAITEKYAFINQAFSYLDSKFSFWKISTMYFTRNKKIRFLYTKKLFWKLFALLPQFLRKRIAGEKSVKHKKAAVWFEKEYRTQQVNANRILVSSKHGSSLHGNMFYILKALCIDEVYDKYEIGIVCTKRNEESMSDMLEAYGIRKDRVKFLAVNSKEYTNFLATAKYLFNDSCFPQYFVKRKEQICLNTLERIIIDNRFNIAKIQKNLLMTDYLLCPQEDVAQNMLRKYMLEQVFENRILVSEYPYNEAFSNKERRGLIRTENEMTNMQCFAFVMNTSGEAENNSDTQKNAVLEYLEKAEKRLGKNQIMYVKLSAALMSMIRFETLTKIKVFPKQYETYDFLNACDIFVTESFEEISMDKYVNRYGISKDEGIAKHICDFVVRGIESGVTVETAKCNMKEKVLIHFGSLREKSSFQKFKEIICDSNLTDRNYFYTFDFKNLMGREAIMETFPQELSFLERNVIADTKFDLNIIFGRESAEEIRYVSEREGRKILYLIAKEDININIPESIYMKYDLVCAETEEVMNEMKERFPRVSVSVNKVRKMQDLIL